MQGGTSLPDREAAIRILSIHHSMTLGADKERGILPGIIRIGIMLGVHQRIAVFAVFGHLHPPKI